MAGKAAIASILAALCCAAQAGTVVLGGPGDASAGNCLPFGCETAEYQQVYAAVQFAGPVTITGLTFYNLEVPGGSVAAGTYEIRLSTTSAAVNGLSVDFGANVGADEALFAVFNGGVLAGPSFTISGDGFAYDPSKGNLLMDIRASNAWGASVYLDARHGTANGAFSRMVDGGWTGTENYGLVTGFTVAVVPEPATTALMALGGLLLMLSAARRRA